MAAVSFWRIRAAGSLKSHHPCGRNPDDQSPTKAVSVSPAPDTAATLAPASASTLASWTTAMTPSVCAVETDGATKGKFTVYYENDREVSDGELTLTGDGDFGNGVVVVGGGDWCDGWERTLRMRMGLGDMGWYRYQDLTVLDGKVVRLWDGCRGKGGICMSITISSNAPTLIKPNYRVSQHTATSSILVMPSHFSFFLTLLLALFLSLSSEHHYATAKSPDASQDLVRSSCVHASYPNICLRTLSSYTGPAKTPRDVAQAAVKVSLSRARKVSGFLAGLRSGSKREQAALSDCIEQIAESVDELSNTLKELKHLRSGTFRWQMSNAETWVSAALTNEDTCLDGFREIDGKVRSDVKRKITNVARVTSNALYLINRLDQTRRQAVFDP
ncbi:hypothetical protein F0562_029814 [Nyssa sinensis]|uniref:Pectinesterase inhibitor domain-containing protein n=1 Tax=Nyssa sinensis TaxID=561372 RepID=A0A5J5AWL1_9ASTE|nr:hypothetical protein F0562_029814 [Nyssa sinensis]